MRTLLEIKRTTKVTTQELAERARLSVAEVFTVETGGFIARATAQRVVGAFNRLSGMRLTLDDIALHDTTGRQPEPFKKVNRYRSQVL